MTVTDLMYLHEACGHNRVDEHTVDIGNAVMSTEPGTRKSLNMPFSVRKVSSVRAISNKGLSKTKDPEFEAKAKVPGPNSCTYKYGTAKAACVEFGNSLYVSFVENSNKGNKNGARLFQKLFNEPGEFYYITFDNDEAPVKLEKNGHFKTVVTDKGELYEALYS
jgi:hypothetical protein